MKYEISHEMINQLMKFIRVDFEVAISKFEQELIKDKKSINMQALLDIINQDKLKGTCASGYFNTLLWKFNENCGDYVLSESYIKNQDCDFCRP
jgi:hypothetical protein